MEDQPIRRRDLKIIHFTMDFLEKNIRQVSGLMNKDSTPITVQDR